LLEDSGTSQNVLVTARMPLVQLGCVLALSALFAACRRAESPPVSSLPTVPASAHGPWFEDVSGKTGLDFVHDSGATGQYFMPESIGSGGAVFDYDNDGRLDVYLVHCVPPGSASRNRLFHQEADGRFRDVSAGSGLDVAGCGMGAYAGDVNNDGFPDLLLTEYGTVRLFLNRGTGHFENVTTPAGIDNTRWATAASFFDFDRDGWLDLVIANYVDYSPTQKCYDTRGGIEYCGPQGMSGTVTKLFRNLGAVQPAGGAVDGQALSLRPVRFEDVTVSSGLARAIGPALGIFCADFNGDRWPDVFIADDGQPNRLFINQRNGTFVEEAAQRGLAYNALGSAVANMGVAFGDVDGDGLFDLFATHLLWEQHALWKQGPRGLFQDQTSTVGLASPAWRGTGFGAVLADFDLDGAVDLAFVDGGIKRGNDSSPRLHGLAPFWSPYAQRNQIFANDGSGRFTDVSTASPDFSSQAAVGRGLACGDIDNDGALDLLACSAGGPVRLLRNIAKRRGHWLSVRAVDSALGGRDAYGAEITVRSGSQQWWRIIQPSSSYLVSNDPRAHFGLGPAVAFDEIAVIWPDGNDEVFPGGDADRPVLLRRGTGKKP
jgi:hypothetical protein